LSNQTKQIILKELVAHRGASEHAPENTMAAFRLAEQQGAQWLEFDVSTAGDATPIILHDSTTDRCSDKQYKINELTMDNLSTIDAGSWFAPEFTGERIPLFKEVLEWLRGNKLRANVEIKRHKVQQDTTEFVQPIVECLLEYQDLWPRLLVTSFDTKSLEYCLNNIPQINCGALFDELPDNWLALISQWDVSTIHINYQHLSKAMLVETRKRNIITRCYTPKKYDDIESYLQLGLSSVIVNSPQNFIQAINDQFE